MKKSLLLLCFAITACSSEMFEFKNFVEPSEREFNKISNAEWTANDSLLPYFEFSEDGNKTIYSSGTKRTLSRKALVLDSLEEFFALEESIAEKISKDNSFKTQIARPLDYVCKTSLLALNEIYETISLKSGIILLDDKILFEQCEYIGFPCSENCDESSEKDPHLTSKRNLILKKEIKSETYDSKTTVEIYPYRMIASSFVTNISKLYHSAGSETYFKKRQRVWRGPFKGMVWRWADFDPDRNGIRTYCFSGCKVEKDSYGYFKKFSCKQHNHATDMDNWLDTEDITVRCALDFPITNVKLNFSVSEENGISPNKPTGKSHIVESYDGGVIGYHYVQHGENHFKAITSKKLSKEVIKLLRSEYEMNYR